MLHLFILLSLLCWCVSANADIPVTDLRQDNPSSQTTNSSDQELSVEQRISRIENILSNQSELLGQISSLQSQLQDLRGQVEILNNQLQQLKNQQLKFFSDTDQRLKALETPRGNPQEASTLAPTVSSVPSLTPTPASSALSIPDNENDAYQASLTALKAKRYPEAEQRFQAFLKRYPDSQYAPNAYYWSGELYLVQKQTDQAVEAFNTLIRQYPQHTKVPDALLKLAFIQADQGQKSAAIAQLKKIIKLYPNSAAANLAKVKVQSLTASSE